MSTTTSTECARIPRRPWVLSKQYGMTLVISQDNDIVLGTASCQRLGEDALKFIVTAVNEYHPKETQKPNTP